MNFSASSKKFTEGQTAIAVSVTLDAVSTVPVRVYYNLSGDAIYMVDHNLGLGYIEVPAGQLSAQITFDTLNNTMDSNDKDLDVYITHTDQPDFVVGINSRQRFVIKNTTNSYKKSSVSLTALTTRSLLSWPWLMTVKSASGARPMRPPQESQSPRRVQTLNKSLERE